MTVTDLPHVNATLNSLSTILIVLGYVMIRRNRVGPHKACMLSATVVSMAFLVCYLIYHFHVLTKRFEGPDVVRAIYLCILFSHVVLAAATPVLVGITLYNALRGRFDRHRRIARWTLPIWLYVSVTGVVVYIMLYHYM